MRLYELLAIMDNSTSGSTASGNVATSVATFNSNAIGPGFDPQGDFGIYPKPDGKKNKENKPIVIKR